MLCYVQFPGNLLLALQESLEATIGPSVESLLAALEAYRAAGGEGLIFVNDDGLQLLDKIERHALHDPAVLSLMNDMQICSSL